MKRKPLLGIFTAVLGALVILIPYVLLPVCSAALELVSGKAVPMKCFWTARAELALGILIIAAGILLIAARNYSFKLAVFILVAMMGVFVILFPTLLIGVCDAATHMCRMGTLPGLSVAGALIIAVGTAGAFLQWRAIKEADRSIENE